MFAGGLILAIMILPIITAVSRDVLRAVPRTQIEGSLALGRNVVAVVRGDAAVLAERTLRGGDAGALACGGRDDGGDDDHREQQPDLAVDLRAGADHGEPAGQ
jgi:hypothetical protein